MPVCIWGGGCRVWKFDIMYLFYPQISPSMPQKFLFMQISCLNDVKKNYTFLTGRLPLEAVHCNVCLIYPACACEDSLLFVLVCSYYVFWSRLIIFLTECKMFPFSRILPMVHLPKVPKVLWNRFCCFQIENVMVLRLIGSNCSRVPQCTATHLLPLDELALEAWRKMPWTKLRWM